MKTARDFVVLSLLTIAGCGAGSGDTTSVLPLVIAHRGASGYLPEHTLAAKAMAYGQGADYIEQDLVMTRDGELIVLHDIHLDAVTNIGDVFPDRIREDGRYYAIDFTLNEIRELSVFERFVWDEGVDSPVFSDRFPPGLSAFRVHTFAEEIELIQGLNRSTGRVVGIYPEMKNPKFHHDAGKDIARATLAVLKAYGYSAPTDPVLLQCFDQSELQRIHSELLPALELSIRLIQLLAPSEAHRPLITEQGLAAIAEYAVGIGPSMGLIVDPDSEPSALKVTDLVSNAHAVGLQVHPYTFRRDAGEIPGYASDYNDLLRIFLHDVGVDGVFTDFPDLTLNYVRSNQGQSTD
ncbi:MAG: glycerophosphodiester phosphodiesterase [Gammaproteobacteria bacterium]|nr:glycerophosphodiester phosphodiesterase [Gammaproteobacteria bacterium]